MAEDKNISKIELKDAIAVAMAAAFGFVIALIWKEFVMAGLDLAGIYPQVEDSTANPWVGWAIFGIVAVVITVIMILLILYITKWGKKPEAE
jgi:hypothetical protein